MALAPFCLYFQAAGCRLCLSIMRLEIVEPKTESLGSGSVKAARIICSLWLSSKPGPLVFDYQLQHGAIEHRGLHPDFDRLYQKHSRHFSADSIIPVLSGSDLHEQKRFLLADHVTSIPALEKTGAIKVSTSDMSALKSTCSSFGGEGRLQFEDALYQSLNAVHFAKHWIDEFDCCRFLCMSSPKHLSQHFQTGQWIADLMGQDS